MNSKEEIQKFVAACDNMINSKFILVDKRIGDILKTIAQTKPVYNVIAESVINFNFDAEWKIATAKRGELRMPEEASKLVAMVFFMLNSIDSGKINISELLMHHFSHDEDKRSSYTVFCERTILPFKQAIENMIFPKAKAAPAKTVTVKTGLAGDVASRIEFLAKDLKEYVFGVKKIKGCPVPKNIVLYQIEVLLMAAKAKDKDAVGPIVSVLASFAGKDKEFINRINGIIEVAPQAN